FVSAAPVTAVIYTLSLHDALPISYYGRAYGIEVAGIQGISTEAEASIADIRATAQRLVEAEIPAIFVETTINPRTIQAVIDAARSEEHTSELQSRENLVCRLLLEK